MKYKLRQQAVSLRQSGYSLKEISQALDIAKSTASLWLRDIELDAKALERLQTVVRKGQLKAAQNKREKTNLLLQEFKSDAERYLEKIDLNPDMMKICCAIIYWCEGGKHDQVVQFTNSDSNLVATFLNFLRKGFDIDEKKLRVCMHLHDYHSENKQKEFWSKITAIPKTQFIKSYQKKNTGKRSRKDYQGCIMIKYYDVKVMRELLAVGQAFLMKYRGVR